MTRHSLRIPLFCCVLAIAACSKEAPEDVESETVVPVWPAA